MVDPRKSFASFIQQSRLVGASDDELARLYATVPMIYAAANFRARNIAAIPMVVTDRDGEPLEDTSHNLARMFKRGFSLDDTFRRTELSICFYGYALWYVHRNVYGLPASFQWINPLSFMKDIDGQGNLRGFNITRGSSADVKDLPNYIPVENSVYFNLFDFEDDHDGIAPSEVAFLQATALYEGAQTAYSVFSNLAVPYAHVQPKDTVGAGGAALWQQAANRLMELVSRTLRGSHNRGQTVVTPDRWEWQILQTPFKDLEMATLTQGQREDIAIAFEMPIELLIPSASNYAQYEGAKRTWGEGWLKVQAEWYASLITEQLAHEYDGGLSVEPDFTEVDFLKEDEAAKVATVTSKYTAGAMSLAKMMTDLGEEAPPGLETIYNVPGIGPVPAQEIPNLWRYRVVASSADIGTETVGISGPDDTPDNPDAVTVDDTEDVDPDKALVPLWVGLKIGPSPDLVQLQNRVKEYCKDTQVNWNEPADFHVTLAYAPSADEGAAYRLARTLYPLDLPELKLNVGSLKTFDTLGEYAVHFRIRRNSDLIELQESVYDAAIDHNIGLNAHAKPDAYLPHITMGYASERPRSVTFTGNISVEPVSLIVAYGDKTIFERSIRADDDQWKELKNWQIVTERKGVNHAFAVKSLPAPIEQYVIQHLEAGLDPALVFGEARRRLFIKSIQSTRIDFEDEFLDLLNAGRANRIDKRRFAGALRNMIAKYGNRAYRDGLVDGGVTDATTDDDDLRTIDSLIKQQSGFVSSLANDVYGMGISEADAVQRPAMWFNGSIGPFYTAGLGSADANGMYEWVLGQTEEHCPDCLRLDGQVHRLRDWIRRNLKAGTVGQDTKCKGFHCDCDLVKTSARAKGGF